MRVVLSLSKIVIVEVEQLLKLPQLSVYVETVGKEERVTSRSKLTEHLPFPNQTHLFLYVYMCELVSRCTRADNSCSLSLGTHNQHLSFHLTLSFLTEDARSIVFVKTV